jgi:hypothetical protein
MNVDAKALADKINNFYPEIAKNNLTMTVKENTSLKSWEVQLAKDGHVLSTYLERQDAEDCLSGKECVYLSHQIKQFLFNYCAHSKDCPV